MFLFALSFCYWQLPLTNPGFNNSPFKFTKYSNAYMLVYVRESDKDKIICNVDEKDIARHLQVSCLIHWFHMIFILYFQLNMLPFQQYVLDKVKERTRGKREEEEGKGWGSFVHHCKGHNSSSPFPVIIIFFFFWVLCMILIRRVRKVTFNFILFICWPQIARDDDLHEQIGKDIFFDLVDHDKVRSFRIQKQMPFTIFKVWPMILLCN